MEYKVKSPKLQDIITKTVEIYATAGELGTIDSDNVEIDVADIHPDLVTADVLVATNLEADEPCTHVVAAGVLTLDSTTAIAATDLIHLVIRIPS